MDREKRAAVRAAMLSVYHHSIGSRLELRGAPAVLVPPEVEPLSLDEALQAIAPAKPRLREAIWTLARAVPAAHPANGGHIGRADRYPRELLAVIDSDLRGKLETFDRRRTKYRQQAHLFSAALIAYAQSDEIRTFNAIREQFETLRGEEENLDEATREAGVLGQFTVSDYLREELADTDDRTRGWKADQLRRLEQELGLNLATFAQEFADAVAFTESFGDTQSELAVFPTSAVTVQDSRTLQTQVTVTALVVTEHFHCLQTGMDPPCWSLCSDAFRDTGYVEGPFDLTRVKSAPTLGLPAERAGPWLLEEDVTISWGADERELGSFHNILNINKLCSDENTIDIEFDLNRSICSRILWDERPGGILVDEGYLKARPVTKDVWRVTTRKTLRFSDRTPYSGGPGWNDFGQVLNYLAPATLSWWIESEMYSATCEQVLERARERRAEEGDSYPQRLPHTPPPPSDQGASP